jgi:hypothetical protein
LPFVVYGCETWSLSLWEEHGLRVLENEVLRKIFGPKREDVTGGWRKLRNGDLYGSIDMRMGKARRMRLAVHAARMERRNSYSVLVRKSEGRKPHRRPRRR